jgi:hypothetical protein
MSFYIEDGKLKQRKKPIKSSQFSDCRTCPHRKDVEYCKNFCKKKGNNENEVMLHIGHVHRN